jgi:hypothetical protein
MWFYQQHGIFNDNNNMDECIEEENVGFDDFDLENVDVDEWTISSIADGLTDGEVMEEQEMDLGGMGDNEGSYELEGMTFPNEKFAEKHFEHVLNSVFCKVGAGKEPVVQQVLAELMAGKDSLEGLLEKWGNFIRCYD